MGTRSSRLSALFVGSCAYCLALSACGGAGAAGSEAPAKMAPATPRVDAETAESSEEEAVSAPAQTPKATLCDDGTCSPCGAGVCPSGWYCDESASGGPACGWLPRCAPKASCACLSSKLGAGCKCNEQGGGLHVTCR